MDYFFYTLINLVLFLLAQVVVNYFKEKGKNLATKEDIAGITKKVEEVKKVFFDESIKLKNELDLLSNFKLSFFNVEKKVLMKFSKNYQVWIRMISYDSLTVNQIFDNTEVDKYLKKIDKAFNVISNSKTDLNMFIENSRIITLSDELMVEANNAFRVQTHKYLRLIKDNNNKYSLTGDGEAIQLERNVIYNEHHQAMKSGSKAVIKIFHSFREECRKHLRESMNHAIGLDSKNG